jgi:hypothetical protein
MKTFLFKCGEWSEAIQADNIFEAMNIFQMWKDATLDVDYSNYSRFDQFEKLSINLITSLDGRN